MLRRLRGVAVDATPMRVSEPFRRLALGQIVSGLGTQAALVALPYQIFVISRSATLVGLLGAFELGPMIVVSLVGGALIDRVDRRRVLALAQLAIIAVAVALVVVTLGARAHRPPVIAILLLGGVLAGASALDSVTRGAIVPGLLTTEHLRSGLAFNYGVSQASGIVGPALGGLLIGVIGVGGTYAVDAATCLGMLAAALSIGPQRPRADPSAPGGHPPVRRAIADGLRFVARTRALAGSFVIDLNAMAFGMPRALFAVLALTVYHAGARGTGFLYAAVALGGTVAVLTSGWVARADRLGRIVIAAVLGWGAAILGAGFVRSIGPAVALLTVAGWADGISAVCRSTISQTLTPDRMRGRMSSVYSLVVTSGPRLGDIESGLVAGLVGALDSVVIGGAACIAGVALVTAAWPELARYDARAAMEAMSATEAETKAAEGVSRPARPRA